MPTAPEIFRVFVHLGVTAFGGLAMVEPMRRRVVEQRKWLSQAEFLDGLALCQMVPGATVVQLATYVGQRLRGPAGALAGAGGFILPAFVLMLGLSWVYVHYGQVSWVQALSRGLNAVVIALLLQAFWHLGQAVRRHWLDLIIAGLALGAFWLKVNYLAVFLGAGLARLIAGPKGAQAANSEPAAPGLGWARPELRALFIALAGCGTFLAGLWHLSPLLARMAGLMFKVGLISFGGGYVMIPVLQWEVVDRLGWLTLRQFLDGILLSYVTPGPLIILAAFVGFVVQGVLGAAVATAAIFLPPILIVITLAPFYQKVKAAGWMRQVIQGILDALVGMLALVTVQMGLGAVTDVKTWGIMTGAAVALIALDLNLLWVIAAAALLSLMMF